MKRYSEIRKNAYYDSVTLMLISSRLAALEGIQEAAVMMGTDHNRDLMTASGLVLPEEIADVTPNDLMIGILGETDEVIAAAMALLTEQFESRKQSAASAEGLRVKTTRSAVRRLPGANLAIVSVPGASAAREAKKALDEGLHVLMFSDNVTLEEEIALKEYAVSRGLLMMGPDCGTAVINGVALGFANVIRRGPIGIAAASGTGLQELTCIIDRMGSGVTQALGTGGRDLKASVGGKMMLMELEALAKDPETKVIGIISKPPAREVMEKILNLCKTIDKPMAACFLGGDPALLDGTGILATETMEDTAAALVALANGEEYHPITFTIPAEEAERIAAEEAAQLNGEQKYLRGLYSGGTLAYEAQLLFPGAYSNIAIDHAYQLEDPDESREHTLVDMGEDFFTNGMPHPMIDMRLRAKRMVREAADPQTAVILMDCVLGFGCHEDPAGQLAEMVAESRKAAGDRHITFIASVCGTDDDIQERLVQMDTLREAGIIVMDSNAQAVRMAKKILEKKENASC